MLSTKNKFLISLLIFIIFAIFIFLINDILLPFIVSLIAAYLLDPLADKLESWKLSRGKATIIIIIGFFIIVTAILVWMIPILYEQLTALSKKIPQYINNVNDKYIDNLPRILEKSLIPSEYVDKITSQIGKASSYIFDLIVKLFNNLLKSSFAVISILSLIFITPIITFYTLRDWDSFLYKTLNLVPPKYRSDVTYLLNQIDLTLSGYLRGQLNVCLFLGAYYTIGLSLAQLDFSFVIGILTGILSFIPYVGSIFGFAAAISVAFLQFGDLLHILIIAAIFLSGQFLEGNFITPKLIGDKVNLHPVWIIFGLMASGSMFGITGILIGVPLTAIAGVVIRFSINKYKNSSLFLTHKKSKKS